MRYKSWITKWVSWNQNLQKLNKRRKKRFKSRSSWTISLDKTNFKFKEYTWKFKRINDKKKILKNKLKINNLKFIATKIKSKNYKRGCRIKSGNCQIVMIILHNKESQAFGIGFFKIIKLFIIPDNNNVDESEIRFEIFKTKYKKWKIRLPNAEIQFDKRSRSFKTAFWIKWI